MPDDATTAFPDMHARAVVSLALVLVTLLVQHPGGSHVPPSSSLPLLYNNLCWCHRAYPIPLTHASGLDSFSTLLYTYEK